MGLLGYPDGTSDDAVSGRNLREVIHPDDYEDMDRLFDQSSTEGGKAGFEKRMLKNSGEVFWEQVFWRRQWMKTEPLS